MSKIKRSDGRTHYDGCWKAYGHHDCAIALVDELKRQLGEARDKALEEAAQVAAEHRDPLMAEAIRSLKDVGKLRSDNPEWRFEARKI